MRQIVTIDLKRRFTNSQICQLWSKFERMYVSNWSCDEYGLGKHQDRFHRHSDVWVAIDRSQRPRVATLSVRTE